MSTDREIIRLALYDAIDWQRGIVEAYAHIPDSPDRANAVATIKRYKTILRKRYGTDRNAAQDAIEKLPTVSVIELMKQTRGQNEG